MYEVEQELEAGGITLEEYTEMLEALNDKPSLFELVLNKWNDFWQGKGEELFEVIGKKHFESFNLKILNILQQVKKTFNIAYTTKYDPLILDLDGDGYNVETKENGTNFDLDKNGFAEKINWTKKDGFLCLDLNGNGTIDNGGELFGDKTLLADGTTAKNGFEALAVVTLVSTIIILNGFKDTNKPYNLFVRSYERKRLYNELIKRGYSLEKFE